METPKTGWLFKERKWRSTGKYIILNPCFDIVPGEAKQIFEKLFGTKLEYVVRFQDMSVNSYAICLYSNHQLIAKASYKLQIVDKSVNIAQLKENNRKHKLNFNFNDLSHICVPRSIWDGQNWDVNIIRKKIKQLINTEKILNNKKKNM